MPLIRRIYPTIQANVCDITTDDDQNLGFLFLPVYFESGFITFPLLRSLSFRFATMSLRLRIFLPLFFLKFLFLSYLFIFTSPSPSSWASPSAYISSVLPATSTMPRFLLTPASITK